MDAPERLRIAQGKWIGLIFFGARDPFPIVDELHKAEVTFIRYSWINGEICETCAADAIRESARNYVARVGHYVYNDLG